MGKVFVDYRFGDRHLINDFINPNLDWYSENARFSPLVLQAHEGDTFVEEVATFIRDGFIYPMMGGYPSADGQLLRCRKSMFQYCFKKCVPYVWSFPQECLSQRIGICVDTSNLACSLLISKVSARACLGEVRNSKTDELLGLHEWVDVFYKGSQYIMETTVHGSNIITLVVRDDTYERISAWAQTSGIYYVLKGSFDNKDFAGDPSIVGMMAFPSKILHLGYAKIAQESKKRVKREWEIEELTKVKIIMKAFQG